MQAYSLRPSICAVVLINSLLTWIFYNQAPFSIKKKVKVLLAKEENIHLLDENELNINESNIILIDTLTTTKYSWESIVRYAVTKEFFFLYINTIQALIIPKRLLKGEKDIENFDKYLTAKIPLSSSFRSMGM